MYSNILILNRTYVLLTRTPTDGGGRNTDFNCTISLFRDVIEVTSLALESLKQHTHMK